MNGAEAIQPLRAAGLRAETRDWFLGHTVFVVGQGSFTRGGVVGRHYARWIYQKSDAWYVNDGVKEGHTFPLLVDAVIHAMIALKHEGYAQP
jgi:hypothetical protein